MPAPVLKTKRLILRPWTDEDVKDLALLNKDPKVMEFFPALLSILGQPPSSPSTLY